MDRSWTCPACHHRREGVPRRSDARTTTTTTTTTKTVIIIIGSHAQTHAAVVGGTLRRDPVDHDSPQSMWTLASAKQRR